jgi:hypothetical protein
MILLYQGSSESGIQLKQRFQLHQGFQLLQVDFVLSGMSVHKARIQLFSDAIGMGIRYACCTSFIRKVVVLIATVVQALQVIRVILSLTVAVVAAVPNEYHQLF